MNSGTVQGKIAKYLLVPQSEGADEAAGFMQGQYNELFSMAARLLLLRPEGNFGQCASTASLPIPHCSCIPRARSSSCWGWWAAGGLAIWSF